MDFSKSSRVSLNIDPIWKCCDKQHFMKYEKDSIKEYFVLNTSDFVNLWRHHKKFVWQKCDFVCPKKEICSLHERLYELTDFVDWIRDRNLNENTVVSKVVLFFEKDSTRRGAFWWYAQDIWDFKDVLITHQWVGEHNLFSFFCFFVFFFEESCSNCYRVNR